MSEKPSKGSIIDWTYVSETGKIYGKKNAKDIVTSRVINIRVVDTIRSSVSRPRATPSNSAWRGAITCSWIERRRTMQLDRRFPHLPLRNGVVTHAPMNKQTQYIVGAIFGAALLYMGYDRYTNPNLDGLSLYQRCDYHAYYQNHGGSVDQCRQAEAEAAAGRLRVAAGYSADPDVAAQEMQIENQVKAAGAATGDDGSTPTKY